MTLLFLVLLATPIYLVSAQDMSLTSTIVTTTQCDADDRCTCSVDPAEPCDLDYEYRAIQAARAELAIVKAYLSGEILESAQGTILELVARLSVLESSLYNQSISLTLTELSGLQDDVAQIQITLAGISDDRNNTVLTQLQAEVNLIQSSLISLASKNPIAVRVDMEAELEKVRARLVDCSVLTEAHQEQGLDFLGDALPFNKSVTSQNCPALPQNITIGEPVTYKFRSGLTGMWMKDPMPTSEEVKNRVYEIRTSAAVNQQLHYWNNLDDYESEIFESKRKTETCLFHSYGTKQLFLNGKLYWFDAYRGVNKVKTMDLMASPCTSVDTPFIHVGTGFNYLGNTQTYADLNFDETGLYDVYADSRGDLIISKLNPVTLVVEQNWNTGKQKSAIANLFMICGRLYTTDDFRSRHLSGLQWGFDTNNGEEFHHKLTIESKYSYIRELSYNPREKAIFGWDNHAVLYPVSY